MKTNAEKWVSFYKETLEDLVALGVEISLALFQNSDIRKIDNFSGYMYLKNLLEILDSISVNISKGLTGVSTKTLNRVALEYFFGAYYLFYEKNEYMRKCNDIAFMSLLEERKGFEPMYKENLKKTSKKLRDQYKLNIGNDLLKLDYSENQKYFNNLLNHPDFQSVYVEYKRTKNKEFFKKKSIVPWYSLWDGPNTIESLAHKTNTWQVYDSIYRNFSLYLHGHKSIELNRIHKNEDGSLFTYSIGTPYELNFVSTPTIYICNYLFSKIINHFIKDKNEIKEKLDKTLLYYIKINPKKDPFDPILNSFIPFPE